MEDNTITPEKDTERTKKNQEICCIIILSIMLLLTPVLSLFTASDLTPGRLIYLLTFLTLYAVPLSFLKLRTYYKVMSFLLPFSLLDIVHLTMYKHSCTLMWVYTSLVVEGTELNELIRIYWPLVVLVLAAFGTYWIINQKYVRKAYVASPRARMWGGIAAGTWIVFAVGMGIMANCTNTCTAFTTALKVPPYDVAIQSIRLKYYLSKLNDGFQNAQTYRFGATTSAPDDELVILFMGESSRYGNWQINGYERPTSPRLEQRQDQLIRFDSVYSAANLTILSVPMLLSRATPSHLDIYTKESSFMDAIHESGYNTAWIADQSLRDKFLLDISGKCDYIYYIESENLTFHDQDILEPLRNHICSDSGRQFVFFHTKGCHFKYNSRYTPEYSVFRPDLNDVSFGNIRQHFDIGMHNMNEGSSNSAITNVLRTILTNSYDNTILYADMMIDSVISLVEQTERPAVVLYVSDHGENLLDDDNHRIFHGQVSNSLYEYHVPMFVWASPAWKERHPEMVSAMQNNSQKRMSTMNLFHTILSLTQVSIPQAEQERSAASEHFIPDSVTWLLSPDLRPVRLDIH